MNEKEKNTMRELALISKISLKREKKANRKLLVCYIVILIQSAANIFFSYYGGK